MLELKYEKLGGKVDWVRLGGQKVRAGSKLCFAIERDRNISAAPTNTGGIVFSDTGAGLLPVAIIANSEQDLKMAMRGSTGFFYIDPKSTMMEEEMMGAFKICVKLSKMREMKPLEIHDATDTIIKNVSGFGLGFVAPSKGILGAIFEPVSALLDGYDAGKKAKSGVAKDVSEAFGSKGKATNQIACVVHIYPMKGGYATGKDRISVRDVAKLIFPTPNTI